MHESQHDVPLLKWLFLNVVQVSGSSARQLKPLSTQAASRPTKDQCDDLQVNNQIVESNQELVIFRISVDNLSYGNNGCKPR